MTHFYKIPNISRPTHIRFIVYNGIWKCVTVYTVHPVDLPIICNLYGSI